MDNSPWRDDNSSRRLKNAWRGDNALGCGCIILGLAIVFSVAAVAVGLFFKIVLAVAT